MRNKSFVHSLTKILVDFMFFGGILCCIAVPFIMPSLASMFRYTEAHIKPFTVILVVSGLCAVFMLWQLKSMYRTLLNGAPFVDANVGCLRKCSVACFIISILFIVKATFWFTVATVLIVIVFIMLGLFCLTLKDLFKQAVTYKEENDGTV